MINTEFLKYTSQISLYISFIYLIIIWGFYLNNPLLFNYFAKKNLTNKICNSLVICSICFSRYILNVEQTVYKNMLFITNMFFFSGLVMKPLISFGLTSTYLELNILYLVLLFFCTLNSVLRVFFRLGYFIEKNIVLIGPEMFERITKNSFNVFRRVFQNSAAPSPGQGMTRMESYTRTGVLVAAGSLPLVALGVYETHLNRLAAEKAAASTEKAAEAAIIAANAAMKESEASLLKAQTKARWVDFQIKSRKDPEN